MSSIADSVTKGNPEDALVLYGFGVIKGTVSCVSPYVGKVELFLRMNEIPYEVKYLRRGSGSSPKGTGPYIKHGDVELADSAFILDYLTNTYADKIKVKSNSDPKQGGIAVAAQSLCENHLYWGLVWFRWVYPEGFNLIKPIFFGKVGFPLSMLLPGRLRQDVVRKMQQQGFGRHSANDVFKLLDSSLKALSGILGKNKYITGKQPCPADCSIFGVLDSYLNFALEPNPLGDLAKKYPNLITYLDNMKNTYFPEENPSKFLEGSDFK